MMKEPTDFIGNILAKLINLQLANSSMREKMANWNMSVVLDTDYYPVSIIFDETISMKTGSVDEPTLIFKMSFGTIISLVKKETSMIRAMLRGSIKVRGLLQNPRAAYRFYTLMNSILKG